MVMFFKLALMNMSRHWKRTLLILVSIIVSVFVMEEVSAMMEGMKAGFYNNMIRQSGHIQIHNKDYQKKLNPYSLLYPVNDYEKIISVFQKNPEIKQIDPILSFGALAIKDDISLNMQAYGITANSITMSVVLDNITEGSFPAGQFEILISTKTAADLDISLGDSMVLLTEDSMQSPMYREYTVSGLYDSPSSDRDETSLYILHKGAEELVYLPGQTMELRIILNDYNNSEAVLASLQNDMGKFGLTGKTWQEINGSLLVFVEIFDVMMIVLNLIILVVAASVITNTFLTNIFERAREYGTLRAIGLKKRSLFSMILIEGITLGMFGSILAVLLALPVTLYFQTSGLSLGEFSDSLMQTSVYYFQWSGFNTATNFLFGTAIAFCSAVFGGLSFLRKSIIETIQNK